MVGGRPGHAVFVPVFLSGMLIFGGAWYSAGHQAAAAVLAAYLVLLPLPVLIASYGVMSGMAISLEVIASTPGCP